jgi:hypothetical protein
MIYLIHCKSLCKCHNIHPPSTTIKGKIFVHTHYGGKKTPTILDSQPLELWRGKMSFVNVPCFVAFYVAQAD